MLEFPLFSVIIPVYNRRELVLEALGSVLGQTRLPGEIILIDDGSDDGTAEACRRFLNGRADSLSWSLWELAHSGMAGAVRNRGVERSRGEWIAFLDSDDLWEPEKLEEQGRFILSHPDLRLVHTRERWLRGDRTISQKKQKHRREGDIFQDALVKCVIGPSTAVLRRDLWEETGGFREDLEIAEDYELWLRITSGEPVGYIDKPLITKRAGSWDNLSDKYGQIEKFRLDALERLIESDWFGVHRGEEPRHLAREEFRRKCLIYAKGCEKRGRFREGALWAAKANRE